MSDASERRGHFVRVLSLVWLLRALLGWLVALPFITIVSASGVGNLLEGDRALFEPGGLWLAELARVSATPLMATLKNSWPYLVLAWALRVLPQGMLAQRALEPFASARVVAQGACRKLGRLLGLSAAELSLKAVWLGVVSLLASALDRFALTANEALRDWPTALCAVLALLGLGALSVITDTRRILLFRSPALRGAALHETVSVACEHARLLGSGYLLRMGLGALCLAASTRLVELIDVSRAGALRLLAVLLVHQSVLVLLTLLEALWLERVSACADQAPATRL